MQISISGKNMDTGLAFQEHAELSLNNVVEKYFHNAVSGHVTLEKADSGFTVKTRVALSRRMRRWMRRLNMPKKGFGGIKGV